MQSDYGKHLCVSGWKSAQARSSSPAVDERRPLCLFVLELVMFVESWGQIHPAVVLTSHQSVSVLGELTDLEISVYRERKLGAEIPEFIYRLYMCRLL